MAGVNHHTVKRYVQLREQGRVYRPWIAEPALWPQ
ncbi:hypothetical protein SMF913_25795 [Streptomyces malaysiensis]|uniref:IS21 family transposase n=1 Tax=Streptomyces malaysiensis TaxID=92644 RepID=A0A2J7YQP2_STRMQ|nr:hypothetical protein SMF913_25795 [Streptomyces malaysiensis]